jgi:hypothetical protein
MKDNLFFRGFTILRFQCRVLSTNDDSMLCRPLFSLNVVHVRSGSV